MRSSVLTVGLILLLPSLPSAADTVGADVRLQSDLAYRQILADAAKAGRIFTRQDAASGAMRHYSEFVARQFVPAADLAVAVPEVISDP